MRRKFQKKILEAKERSADDFIWVKNLMQQYNVQDDIILYLQDIKQNAYASLEKIDTQNKCKEYLKGLVEFAISRTY